MKHLFICFNNAIAYCYITLLVDKTHRMHHFHINWAELLYYGSILYFSQNTVVLIVFFIRNIELLSEQIVVILSLNFKFAVFKVDRNIKIHQQVGKLDRAKFLPLIEHDLLVRFSTWQICDGALAHVRWSIQDFLHLLYFTHHEWAWRPKTLVDAPAAYLGLCQVTPYLGALFRRQPRPMVLQVLEHVFEWLKWRIQNRPTFGVNFAKDVALEDVLQDWAVDRGENFEIRFYLFAVDIEFDGFW